MSTYVVFLKVKVASSRPSGREGTKENGTRKVVFALSQFSGSDYLGAWKPGSLEQAKVKAKLMSFGTHHKFSLFLS